MRVTSLTVPQSDPAPADAAPEVPQPPVFGPLKAWWSDAPGRRESLIFALLLAALALLPMLVATQPAMTDYAAHLARYHGVFAPNCRLRARDVPAHNLQRAAYPPGMTQAAALGSTAGTVEIVDMLRFTTCVPALAAELG